MIVAERAGDVGVHVAKLAAVALVEDEDDVPGVDGVSAVCFDEGGELLDGRDDDRGGCVVDLFGELSGGLVRGDGACGEGVVFLDGLVVQVLAVDDEEDFVDAFHASGELRGLEGGEGLSGTRRVPDVSSGSDGAGLLVHGGCLDTLEDRLGGGDLVGTHHQELSTSIEHAIASEDCEDGALSQEGSRKIGQVGDLVVGGVGPPAGEFVGAGVGGDYFAPAPHIFADVLEAHGVGVVLGVGTVGDDEDLYVAEEAVSGVEGVALVAVDLVECFAQFFAASLEFDVNEGQSVDKDGDVVAVGAQPRVNRVLMDDLDLVAVDVGLVDEADVLGRAVVSGEDLHVVLLDAPGFGNHGIVVSGGCLDDVVPVEASPFVVGEVVVVEGLQLDTQVCFEARRIVDVRVLVGLATQLVDEGVFEGSFALVASVVVTGRLVEADDREVVGEDDGFNAGARCDGGHSLSFLYGSRSRPGLGLREASLPPS